jgi:protein-S-isoprenylcysteine O-methyltransferase Ste14
LDVADALTVVLFTIERMEHVAITIILVIWYAIGALWLVMAFHTKRTIKRRGIDVRVLLLVSFVVAFLLRSHDDVNKIHEHLWAPTATLGWLGVAFMIIGASFGVWARFTIGTNWSGDVTLKEDHELIQRGPYALVRHPIYTALFTMLLGSALAYGQYETAFIFVVAVLVFSIKMRAEERLMSEAFPDQYPEYRRHVKAVIPFIL